MTITDDIRLVIETAEDTRRETGRIVAAANVLQKRHGHEYQKAVTRLKEELNRIEQGTKTP